MRHLLAALALCLCAVAARADTIIHAGRLIADPRQPAESEKSLVIADGRIKAIVHGYVAGDPEKDRIIDLRSATVLPGLIDSHVHLLFELGPKTALQRLQLSDVDAAFQGAMHARRTLEAGFTTVRDLGDPPDAIFGLRNAIAKGWVMGPRIIAAGSSISGTGGHADVDGYRRKILEMMTPSTICDGPYDCRRAVRTAVKYGADVIKITATGGVLSDAATGLAQQMADDELAEIVRTAHALGRKVAAHAHGADGINAALRAGVDSIEHGSMLDDESIRLFKKTGAWLVPTLLAGRTVAEQAEKGGFLPPAIRDKALRLAPVIRDHIVRAYKAGVRIAFGTDSGVSHHGDNGREFLLLKDIGMKNAEIIATATVNAAELLGLADRIGTLEPGKEADIIAVAGDPLADIALLQHVGFVMARGHIAKNDF